MASSLVAYTKISPNKNSPRNHSIDRITPHCYVGQVGIEDMGAWFAKSTAQASSNYGIGQDGRVGMFVSEDDRSWCSSSRENDNRAITIECASDKVDPYAINDKVYASLINLMTDICKRYNKKKLLWFGDKDKTLAYEPASDEMVITVHRWFANKACPGDYIYNRLPAIAATVTARLTDAPSDWTQAGGIPKSKEDFIAKVGACAVSLYSKTKILPSVVIGQCCLETGFGLGSDSTVLVQVNNLLGMKSSLLNSTWSAYTVWKGKSITKITPEYVGGKLIYKEDKFRKYTSYLNCIEDYEMFLLNVRSDARTYKYRKVAGMTDPRKVITAISKGGYATDPSYIEKVMRVIAENNLVIYDKLAGVKESDPVSDGWYRVAESYKDGKYIGQKGAFSSKDNAINLAKSTGLKAFDPNGKQIYPETATTVPDRYVVRRRWGEKKYQIGAFSILSNAKKMADENWGYRVYDLQTPKSAVYKPVLNRRQKLCAACVRLNQWLLDDIAAGKDWRYYNSGHVSESTFWKTRKAGKLYTNCMGGVAFAMKESGLPASDCSWYGQKGGGIRWLNDHAETDLSRHADIINVQNMTPKQLVANGTLQYGDIVTFVEINHTCIYLGNGLSYDSGHAYCIEKGEGAHYVKWIGPLSWSSYHVGKIIRLK